MIVHQESDIALGALGKCPYSLMNHLGHPKVTVTLGCPRC
jgi:hypothetical protein